MKEMRMRQTRNAESAAPGARPWMRLAITVLGLIAGLIGIAGLAWIVNPGTWLIPAVPLFAIWLAIGVPAGLLLLVAQSGRWLPALLLGAGGMLLLYLLGWPLELGNANMGWGLFAVPPVLGGIALALSAASTDRVRLVALAAGLLIIAVFVLPQYLRVVDGYELARHYAAQGASNSDSASFLPMELWATAGYLAVSLVLVTLPWVSGKIPLPQRSAT
jgi:hypothetical protein